MRSGDGRHVRATTRGQHDVVERLVPEAESVTVAVDRADRRAEPDRHAGGVEARADRSEHGRAVRVRGVIVEQPEVVGEVVEVEALDDLGGRHALRRREERAREAREDDLERRRQVHARGEVTGETSSQRAASARGRKPSS
jgi:hypothetical protein